MIDMMETNYELDHSKEEDKSLIQIQIEAMLRKALIDDSDGAERLLKHMEKIGFYTAPCSGGNHLAKPGGLAEHSLNVQRYADQLLLKWCKSGEYVRWCDSVTVCALLHDLGKCGQYGKPNYVPNMVKDGRPTKAEPEQKYRQSADKPYKTNPDLLSIPHEVRSVAIIQQFIDLTEEEQHAILYHNGLYGPFYKEIKGNETLLYMILHFADMWCSRIVESEEE